MEDKSGVGVNAISLPKGGGSTLDQTDAFEVDQLRGTGSYTIPIVLPKARGNLTPKLNLQYNSDAGFGPIGLGWTIGFPSVRRRLDVGVPTYTDDGDVFTFNGEELLRVGLGSYRTRIEKNFWRIQRTAGGWHVRDRSGTLFVLGETAASRLYNPSDPTEVQAWLVDRLEDTNGNVIRYSYRRDTQTISPSPQYSFQAGQLYLDKVEYNAHGGAWLNRVQLVYDFDGPNDPPRSDAQLSYRAGFPLYTAWRLSRIEIHADVPGEFTGLVRSWDLQYQADPDCGVSLLWRIQTTGYNSDGTSESLPPITMTYSHLDVSGAEVRALEGAPQVDLATGDVELVDLTGNGLPDLLRTQPGNHTFWLNNRWRLPTNLALGEGHFAPGTVMAGSPTVSLTQPATHLADVRGKVAADLLAQSAVMDNPGRSATHADVLARNLSWGAQATFPVPPPFNFHDGKARVVDLTGRGRMDVLRADGGLFRHWLNKGDGTYEDRGTSPAIAGLSFQNPEWTFADLNGDGLADLVRVQNGRIEYHPNRGLGHRSGVLFASTSIVMGNGLALRQGVTEWDPDRMLFVDLNGNGLDDAVYLHTDRIHYWLNLSGSAWSDRFEIMFSENGSPVLLTTNRGSVRSADVLGRGARGIMWSGSNQPMRYLPISSASKPLLLRTIDNGIGGQIQIDYRATTRPNGGREWTSRVPFVLHVIDRITRVDAVTGSAEVTEYTFLDGEFDRARREFLGFGEVRIAEIGDDGVAEPTCRTRITTILYHVQPSPSTDPVQRALARALAGSPYRKSVSGSDTSKPHSVVERLYDLAVPLDFDSPTQEVWGTNGLSARDASGNPIPEPAGLALNTHELTQIYDSANPPLGDDRTRAVGARLTVRDHRDGSDRIDLYGRVLSTVSAEDVAISVTPPSGHDVLLQVGATAIPLQRSVASGAARVSAAPMLIKRSELEYAENPALHLVLPLARKLTRSENRVIEDTRSYFDGAAYVGLPLGQVQLGNLSRAEVLAIRADQLNSVYSGLLGGLPDLVALGYRRGEYGRPRSVFGARPCACLRRPRPIRRIGVWPWIRSWITYPFQRLLCSLLCRAEGYGFFVDQNRYRYGLLPSGQIAYGLFTGHKDANGRETQYVYDSFYLFVEQQTDAAGNSRLGEADYRVSKLARVTDANGHVEANHYDALGRIAFVVKPGDTPTQPTITWEYSASDSPTPIFERRRLREDAGAAGTFDSTEYRNGWNQPLQTRVEARGGQFLVSGAVSYNLRGGLHERFLPYFDASPAYAAPAASAAKFRFYVDALDRDVVIRHPDGSEVRRQFIGFATEESDREDLRAGSTHYATPTRFVRDSRNNLTEVHQRLSSSTVIAHYAHDVLNHIRSVRLTGGAAGAPYCEYLYDLLGRRLRIDQVDSQPAYAVFNAGGQVVRKVDGRGGSTELDYDAAGRVFRRRFPGSGEPTIQYEYCDVGSGCDPARNAIGRLASVQDAHGDVELDYDARGRTVRHRRTWTEFGASATYVVELAYDSGDRLRSRTYPQIGSSLPVSLVNRYDEGNLLERIDLHSGSSTTPLISSITYDARGQRSDVVFGNSLSSQFEYDPLQLNLSRITTRSAGGGMLQDLRYCHDREGNVVARYDAVANRADLYVFDALYRLREARHVDTSALGQLPDDRTALLAQLSAAPGNPALYDYSPEGDLELFGDAGGVVYNSRNGRPRGETVLDGKLYWFDAAGALETMRDAADPTITLADFRYNAEGRLVRVDLPPDDLRIEYSYDYEGERVEKRVTRLANQAFVSETRWLGRWISFHRDSNVNHWERVRQYLFDDSKPWVILDETAQVISYVHADHLASSDLVSDGGGNPACTLSYGPFGRELTGNACPDLRHRYNGSETDAESGLVNFGARHYLPATGRWISPDPVLSTEPENHLLNPQTLNAYAYAANNPVTLIDPVGKSPGKYAGHYIDTGQIVTRWVIVDDVPHIAHYRVIEAIPGTWLSKVTYDFGWGRHYSKEQGYGAYQRAIIFPLSNESYTKGVNFDPDKIGTGQRFGVLAAPIEVVTFTEGTTIDSPKPQPATEQGSSWMPDAVTISLSGAYFTPWIVGGGGGIEFVYLFGKGWVIYGQLGAGGGIPGPSGAVEVGPVWNMNDPKAYTGHFIEGQAAGPVGPVPLSGSVFFWPGGPFGMKAGLGTPGAGIMYEHYWMLGDFTDKEK